MQCLIQINVYANMKDQSYSFISICNIINHCRPSQQKQGLIKINTANN